MTPAEIKALRQRLGLTQEEFARKLGVSFPTVNRWERGHFNPSRLAEARLEQLQEGRADGTETKNR